MDEQSTEHPSTELASTRAPEPSTEQPSRDLLRYVAPVAALGTAFVLQTVAVTDVLGSALAERAGTAWMYVPALLLGLAVASCVEGGAAHVMDLYDRHLLARDSVWVLRLAMVAYVVASGAVIHWWADQRQLPAEMSWLLAGMSGSALLLWSRSSRWRHREAMRAAGQLDPALPRLPVAAKLLHPWRSLVTLWLISWEPVATTDEARARYEQWRAGNAEQSTVEQPSTEQRAVQQSTERVAIEQASTERPSARASEQPTPIGAAKSERQQNLARLKKAFPNWRTSMPSTRRCAGALGCSPSTGASYQKLLIAERDSPARAAG